MSKKCRDVLDIVPETVVLAFDIAGWQSSANAAQIARNKAVIDAINKELAKQGQSIINKHFKGETISQEDALKMLKSAGDKVLENRKKELANRVKCAYKESPLGVWLDKNEWVLYLVLPVVVGGAGTWMYVAKVGDTPANWATSMAEVKKSWKVQKLGKITIGTTDVKFVPSKREIAGKVFGQTQWERLAIKLTVGGGMAEDAFSGANVESTVSTAVTRDLRLGLGTSLDGIGTNLKGKSKIDLSYKGSGAGTNLSLALSGVLAYDTEGATSAGAALGAKLKSSLAGAPVTAGVTGSYNRNLRPEAGPADEYKLMVTLAAGF